MLLCWIVALASRLWQLDLTSFGSEQGTLLGGAARFLDSGQIPTTSGLYFTIGVAHPPLITFLLTIPMALSRDPLWAAVFQATVDSLAVFLLYLTGRDFGSPRGGLAAAMLYAVSPAAVLYSRLVWNPDLVAVLSAVGLWGAAGFVLFGDARRFAAAWLAVACAAQLHPSAAVFVPLLVGVALWRHRDLRWRPFLVAGAVLTLILAPYAARQVALGGSDVAAALEYSRAARHFTGEGLYVALSLALGGYLQQAAMGIATGSVGIDWSLLGDPLVWLGALAALIGARWTLWQRGGWLVAVWLLLPLLGALRVTESVFPHYLLDILAPAALLGGLGVAALRPTGLGMGVLVVLTVGRTIGGADFQERAAAMELGPRMGVPLRYAQMAAASVLAIGQTGDLLVGDPETLGPDFAFLTGDRFILARFDSDSSLVVRPRDAVYLTRPGPGADLLAQALGPPASEVRASNGRTVYQIFKVAAGSLDRALAAPPQQPLNVDLGGVMRLTGFDAGDLAAGRQASVRLRSEVLGPAVDQWPDLRLFGHLVGADGHRWSTNPDLNPFRVSDWQRGDVVLTWFDLGLPADIPLGGYWFDIGMYQTYALTPLRVHDGAADLGSRLRIGPLRVAGVTPVTPSSPRAVFGAQEIALVDIKADRGQVALVWRALARPSDDYTVFVHGLDDQGRVVAQHDGQPAGGSFPTRLWAPGDVVRDVHVLSGDTGAVTSLAIGLYRRPSLQRLEATDGAGRSLGDALRMVTSLSQD